MKKSNEEFTCRWCHKAYIGQMMARHNVCVFCEDRMEEARQDARRDKADEDRESDERNREEEDDT